MVNYTLSYNQRLKILAWSLTADGVSCRAELEARTRLWPRADVQRDANWGTSVSVDGHQLQWGGNRMCSRVHTPKKTRDRENTAARLCLWGPRGRPRSFSSSPPAHDALADQRLCCFWRQAGGSSDLWDQSQVIWKPDLSSRIRSRAQLLRKNTISLRDTWRQRTEMIRKWSQICLAKRGSQRLCVRIQMTGNLSSPKRNLQLWKQLKFKTVNVDRII